MYYVEKADMYIVQVSQCKSTMWYCLYYGSGYWYYGETIISKIYKQCPLGVCVNVMITFIRNVEI